MDERRVEAGQLRDVPAHVVAVPVEPGRLAQRVEYPAGPRAVAGPGDPLPVARVVGHVAVGEQPGEVPVPVPPVDVQGPGEERGGDHPGPVVHEALGGELPKAGVDDRDTGASCPPGVQRARVLRPRARARPVVG